MRQRWLLLAGLLLVGMLFVRGARSDERDDAVAAIRQAIDSYVAAYNHGDAAAVAEHWAEDAEYVLPDGERVQGREAILRVSAILGTMTFVGGSALLTACERGDRPGTANGDGVGKFSADEIAYLDEIAETILPETKTPGAKAAKTGAFMALMVSEAYTPRNQQIFRDGMRLLDEACRASANGASFVQATPAERLSLLEALDREQKTVMEERADAPRSRAPAGGDSSAVGGAGDGMPRGRPRGSLYPPGRLAGGRFGSAPATRLDAGG